MKEECGVFAINYYNDNVNIIEHTIKGLEKLQHRGQDSAGVSYIDRNKIQTFKNTGLVKDVFQDHNLCCKTNPPKACFLLVLLFRGGSRAFVKTDSEKEVHRRPECYLFIRGCHY